jgi:APA family basic amino acid/polyamine antiporter
MLVQLLGQTRIFFSMSRDGLLPALFGRVHARFRTPHLSTLLTGAIVAVAAGLLPLTTLSQLVSMGTLLAFTLACLGIIILRRTAPTLDRPFRTPGMPWVPVFGALACVAQMVGLPLATWIRLVVWLAIGMAVYFTYGRRHALHAREERRLEPAAAD